VRFFETCSTVVASNFESVLIIVILIIILLIIFQCIAVHSPAIFSNTPSSSGGGKARGFTNPGLLSPSSFLLLFSRTMASIHQPLPQGWAVREDSHGRIYFMK